MAKIRLPVTTLFLMLALLTSCSQEEGNTIKDYTYTTPDETSNDDTVNEPTFTVWSPLREVRVCETGSEQVLEFPDCYKRSSLAISEEFLFEWIVFHDGTGSCEVIQHFSGTWEQGSDYFLLIDGSGSNLDFYTFVERSENTLHLGNYDVDCNCDGNHAESYRYTEYVKVTE
ncbi:MAG: hypothetical protein R2773_07455 [Flavobacteriaceae bacterium]